MAPTERSKPALSTTKVIPTEINIRSLLPVRMLKMFALVRKNGSRRDEVDAHDDQRR